MTSPFDFSLRMPIVWRMSFLRFIPLCIAMLLPGAAFARDAIHSVGSSTVFPFVAAAAEQFGRRSEFRTPIVEATGTGGGLKMFCSGVGLGTPDIANASRQIKPAEVEDCKKHGVTDIVELKIGYDGIVFVTSVKGADFELTRDILFKALARQVPVKGALADNPYTRWSDIDASLPHSQIRVYGPPPTSGTRDAFVELVMLEACKKIPEYASRYADEDERKQQCQQLREDGRYIEAGENDNLLVQKLSNDDVALAILGYSFLEQNAALVKPHAIDGVRPGFKAIISGQYKVARSLFVYFKKAHAGKVDGLEAFAAELTSDAASGADGYLVMKGLLPLPAAEHEAVKRVARTMQPMKAAAAH